MKPTSPVSPRRSPSPLRGLFSLLLLAAAPAWGQVVINEIDYDQPSTDTAEFVELKNVGGAAVDLDPYVLELVNGTGGGAVVYDSIDLPAVMLAPGDYFVVCANAATVPNCDLDDGPDTNFIQNGDPDAVGLRLAGVLVDAVSYDGDSGAPYTEGSGSGLGDSFSDLDVGISRCPDGVDTDQNNVDLSLQAITPGAANDCPGPQLVINEIDYDQPGTDAAEFVEIRNVGAAAVNLGGINLELVNGAGGGAVVYDSIALPAVSLAPGDYFVVCANAATVPNCDLDDGPDTNFIQNGAPDAVALVQGATILDTVSYEGDTAAPYTEGSGAGLEDTAGPDESLSRCPDGEDTDQNDADFFLVAVTPGAPNDCDAGGGGGELVINEIDYDQPGTDTAEFVEIRNVGADAADLGAFSLVLVNGTGGGAAIYNTIALPSVSLGPGEYFVVCGDAATVFNCDLDASPDSNLVQNGDPDAVALAQGATIVDTVSYGGNTGAPYTEGSGAGLDDPSGAADANKGLSRFPDGVDTDQNNADFVTACITPGAANTSVASDCPAPGPPALVVNEVDYDQPGTDAAEFVEIKNVGSGAASLAGVDLVLVNGSGGGAAVYNTIALPAVSLAAGDYFVVCGNAATVINCDLDVTPDTNLVQNGAPDAVALTFAGMILDTVSYEGDTGVPYTEGVGTTAADSNDAGEDFKGLSRFPDGVDTNVNDADFVYSCITPGSANTDRDTDCTPTGPVFEIWEIQGSGLASPFAGSAVTTLDNVVTCLAPNGFYVQTPAARTDGVLATSDGIFVFTSTPPVGIAVGDVVDVSGVVVEFFGLTEFGAGSTVTVTGNDPGLVPAAVVFDAAVPSPDPTTPSCGAFEFECYESMLVEVPFGTVAGSNQEFGSDPFAEIHIAAGAGRAFREPGVEFPGLMMPPIPTWDGNPEVFELDPDKLGLPNQVIPAGSTFSAKGVIGFEFNHYELWPHELIVAAAPLPVPVRPREAGEITVGSLNLFRLFDDVDDPPSMTSQGSTRNDAVVSTAEYALRRAKLAAYVVEVLDAPDVLGVQEAEKLEVLDDLAADVAALDPSVVYTSYLIEGNDIGTIDSGFMVRDTVQVDAVTQLGAAEILSVDGSLLHDRPPLLLEARVLCDCDGAFDGKKGRPGDDDDDGDDDDEGDDDDDGGASEGCTSGVGYTFRVMVVHNRSLGGIEDPVDGPRVRQKRLEQALSIAQMVQDLQDADAGVRLAVVGDFNAFEFTDGYVDAVGVIKGDFDPAESLLSGPDLVDPNLTDQVLGLPPTERYSFIFRDSFNPVRSRGDSQVLDHALTSQGLAGVVTGFEYGRGNADAAEELVNDDGSAEPANLPLRASDHDGFVLFLDKECPRERKALAIDLLQGVLPTGNRDVDKRLAKAIGSIRDSLASKLWIDGRHISSKRVFDEERQAVQELGKTRGGHGPGGVPPHPGVAVAVTRAINALLDADAILVDVALGEAVAAAEASGCFSGNDGNDCRSALREIERALDEIDDAASSTLAGREEKAIEHYRKAWEHARKAVDHLDSRGGGDDDDD